MIRRPAIDKQSNGLKGRQGMLRHYLFTHRHSALLAVMVAAILVRPLLGDTGAGPLGFSIAALFILLVAVYTSNVDDLAGERAALLRERRRRNIVLLALGLPALADRFAVFVAPGRWRFIGASILWLLFFAVITWFQLRALLRQRQVTGETISLSICVYLLLGFTWALVYAVLYQVQPHAFSFGATPAPNAGAAQQAVMPMLIYFSLTTLSTIGFGDIVPLSLQGRYLAVAEGITGQFYIAILVARLVAVQMSQSVGQRAENAVDERVEKRIAEAD